MKETSVPATAAAESIVAVRLPLSTFRAREKVRASGKVVAANARLAAKIRDRCFLDAEDCMALWTSCPLAEDNISEEPLPSEGIARLSGRM